MVKLCFSKNLGRRRDNARVIGVEEGDRHSSFALLATAAGLDVRLGSIEKKPYFIIALGY